MSETAATPGYRPCHLDPGSWHILVGAYKVAPAGVTIRYEMTFTPKRMREFRGDLHVHTLASDGVHTAQELAQRALRHGLDFLAITDHNQMAAAEALPRLEGLTLIPGIEWTHFRGHALFLGVDRPYDPPFFASSEEEVQARFTSAHQRGALITVCHPFDDQCPFLFDLSALPHDCLEIWSGPMRMSNLRALASWQAMLVEGKKGPICGGSDFHRDHLFIMPGGPTTCVFAPSPSAADLLAGLRQGHAYITFAPNGPALELTAGHALPGDAVAHSAMQELRIAVRGLVAGDTVQVITGGGSKALARADANGDFEASYTMESPGFARVEVWREFIPGVPALPALISNPIYFENA